MKKNITLIALIITLISYSQCLKLSPNANNYVEKEYVQKYVEKKMIERLPEISYTVLNPDNFSLRGGSLVSLEELSSTKFRFKKELGKPDSYVGGLYIEFTYDDFTELDKDLTIVLTKANESDSLNSFYIMDDFGDWGPGNEAINISSHISEGINRINIYELIIANGNQEYIDYYLATNTLTLLMSKYNGLNNANLTNVFLDYEFQFYFENENILNITTGLDQAIRENLVQKVVTEVSENLGIGSNYIVCWGDSLTAGGGWTTQLQTLLGVTVYNSGTGGGNSRTILARQGGDVMIVNNITIPTDNTIQVLIADRNVDTGIDTQNGHKVTPLLQGGSHHINPCFIGEIEGTLQWTGASYSDMTGDWVFTRTNSGSEVVINRPTAIRTDFDINKNNPHLAVIFIGQNGGYDDTTDLIRQHRLMIEHSKAKNTVILGLSSGSADSRADYENAMREEFGRYFVSLRQYLANPIYDNDGVTIISSYGLEDADLIPTQTDLNAIAVGKIPPQLLSDSVHYTTSTKRVIGNMIYKVCKDLNIF